MGKVKSFAAKLAHEASNEGKVMCPVCKTEVKKIKAVMNKKKGTAGWSPRYEFIKVCKCNEADFMAGKTI
ncbi:MAG: hypothetical protein Q8M98_11345 [Candidatus Cloacimonadaceae bacterium]|nr:hypothetical protein [Candidatus Cloacimonadaceae bacterium]MDP3115344.1 hypothetical protein [Candidatus Cloacimonadaceae bacterium]